MKNIISFKDFEKVINGIKKEITLQDEMDSAITKIGGEYYRDTPGIDMAIMLLDFIFCDDSDYPLIDYWIYDLNFGERWTYGKVTTDDGVEIKLETVSDLYDALVKQMAEKGVV